MHNERPLRGSLLTATRRFGAGIDVSEDAVRVAVVSRRLRAGSAVCVDYLAMKPLPPGAVVDGDYMDRAAIADALSDAFAHLPDNGTRRALRCAMGLAPGATYTASVPVTQLIDPHETRTALVAGDPLGVLEPAVLAHAERATGLERGALAIDWSVRTRNNGRSLVSIAASARRHVQARVEAASAAGVALSAIDSDALAALRAMRHASETEFEAHARYLACWLERTGLHGWLIEDGEICGEMRYPAPEYRSIAEALRDLAGEHGPIDCLYAGGDIELLTQAGLPLSALAAMFACPALPFEAAPYCNAGNAGNGVTEADAALRHSPRFAVAFGLALREVAQ
jgi:Tfp pilus assembly PilM family ATPase